MLYLNDNTLKIKKAKRAFLEGMQSFIYERIDKIKTIKKVDNRHIEAFFDIVINDCVDVILIGNPNKLVEINDKVNPLIRNSTDLIKGIEFVFNYETFITHKKRKFDAYRLAELLDISTCVYCNRNYTNTVIRSDGEKITRPQFDHFFDKASNPLLAVSFYNLIPSCSICNSSIKGPTKMNLADFLHPYVDNNLDDIIFSYKYSHNTKTGFEIKIKTPNPSKAKNTVELFAIEPVYNSHTSELRDLIKVKQYFSEKYLSILRSNLLKDVAVSNDDIYRILFGTEYHSVNFVNRPFSKFKSDILKELGVI